MNPNAKMVGQTVWNLTPRFKRKQKPVIRKASGQWVCFVTPGATSRMLANKVQHWCDIQNKKPRTTTVDICAAVLRGEIALMVDTSVLQLDAANIAQRCADQPEPYAAASAVAVFVTTENNTKTLHFPDGSCLSFKVIHTPTVVGRSMYE